MTIKCRTNESNDDKKKTKRVGPVLSISKCAWPMQGSKEFVFLARNKSSVLQRKEPATCPFSWQFRMTFKRYSYRKSQNIEIKLKILRGQ